MKRKFTVAIAVCLIFILFSSIVFASGYNRNIVAWFENVRISIDGDTLELKEQPFFHNDTLFMAVEDFTNYFDFNSNYDDKNKLFRIFTGGILDKNSSYSESNTFRLQQDRLKELAKEAQRLETQLKVIEKKSFPYQEINSVRDMETYLRTHFSNLQGVSLNISLSRVIGNTYSFNATYHSAHLLKWRSLSGRNIEGWIENIVDAVRLLYDNSAVFNGSVAQVTSNINDVSFYSQNGYMYFNHRFSERRAEQRLDPLVLERYLNTNFRRYNNVDFSYQVTSVRNEVELTLYYNQDRFEGWTPNQKMNYLRSLRSKIQEIHPSLNIDGKIYPNSKISSPFLFSFENNRVRSLTLLRETEDYLNNYYKTFAYGGSSFNFIYRINELEDNKVLVRLEGDFSRYEDSWLVVEPTSELAFKNFLQSSMNYIKGIWPVDIKVEAYDRNLIFITSDDDYTQRVSPVYAIPGSGSVASGTDVSLHTSTPGATIYYTLDGSTPTIYSFQYVTPIRITQGGTIRALAVKAGMESSDIETFTYTITTPQHSANLTSLAISGSPDNFSFAPGTYEYPSVTVASNVTSITVTPSGVGTITVNGQSIQSGSASQVINLDQGITRSIIIVHTEQEKSPVTYTISVTRGAGQPVISLKPGYTFTTFIPVFSGQLEAQGSTNHNFTGYRVSLLSQDNDTVYGTVDVQANGSFDIFGFPNSVLNVLMGYKYRVFAPNNAVHIIEGNLP